MTAKNAAAANTSPMSDEKKRSLLKSRTINRSTRTLMPSISEFECSLDNLGPNAPLHEIQRLLDSAPPEADTDFVRAFVAGRTTSSSDNTNY